MKPARLLELDFVRTIATFYVIGIHALAFTTAYNNHIFILSLFFDNAVPIFLILSGVSLGLKYAKTEKIPLRSFYRQNLPKLLWPYLIWGALYFVSNLLLMQVPIFTLANLKTFIMGMLDGRPWYHLYYLPILMGLYLLFPLVLRLARKSWGKALAGSFVLYLISNVLYQLSSAYWFLPFFPTWPYIQPLNWLFLFCFGIIIALHWESVLKKYIIGKETFWLILMLLAFVLYYILYRRSIKFLGVFELNLYTRTFYSLAGFIGLLAIGQQVQALTNQALNKLLQFIVKLSFLIYLIHPLVLVGFDQLTRYTSLKYPIYDGETLVFYLSICAVSILVSFLLYQLPGSYFFGGKKRWHQAAARRQNKA